jgi:ankyrin repeat protein
MDPIHAPPPHAVEALEQGEKDEAVQAGAAPTPRTLWLGSQDCLLQVLCCVAFCGHDARGFSSLTRAFRGDEVLWGCIKDRCGPIGRTCLMACSYNGDLARVRWLLDRGAKLNSAKTASGHTSLNMACEKGHLEVLQELLRRGADVNAARAGDGATSLMMACHFGHLEVVRELLCWQVNVNAARTSDGTTSLLWACEKGRLEIVRELLGQGAKVDSPNIYGLTPLMRACQIGCMEVVRVLIGQGADVNAQPNNGMTPLMWACEKGHLEIARLLLAHHASKTPLGWEGKTVYELIGETAYELPPGVYEEMRQLVKP